MVNIDVRGSGRSLSNNTLRHHKQCRKISATSAATFPDKKGKRIILAGKVQMVFRFDLKGAALRRFEEGSAATSSSSVASSSGVLGGGDGFVRVLLRVTGALDGVELFLMEGSVDLDEVSDRTGLCRTLVFGEEGILRLGADGISRLGAMWGGGCGLHNVCHRNIFTDRVWHWMIDNGTDDFSKSGLHWRGERWSRVVTAWREVCRRDLDRLGHGRHV